MDPASLGKKTREKLQARTSLDSLNDIRYRGKDVEVERVPGIDNSEFSCSLSPTEEERIVTDVQRPNPALYEFRIGRDMDTFDIHRFKVELIDYLLEQDEVDFDYKRLTINRKTGEVREHHPFHVKTELSESVLQKGWTKGKSHIRGRRKNVHTTYDGGLTGFWDEVHRTSFWDWRMTV